MWSAAGPASTSSPSVKSKPSTLVSSRPRVAESRVKPASVVVPNDSVPSIVKASETVTLTDDSNVPWKLYSISVTTPVNAAGGPCVHDGAPAPVTSA